MRSVILRAEFGPTRFIWSWAISSSSRCAGSRITSSATLVNRLQPFSGLFQRVGRRTGKPGLFRCFQFGPQLQGFLPLLKRLNAHNHQIAFAVFGDIDWLRFFMRQIRDHTVVIAERSGRLNNHGQHLLYYSIIILSELLLLCKWTVWPEQRFCKAAGFGLRESGEGRVHM